MSKDKVRSFPFPECWTNDVRMDVLFAPFRPRNVNPENYDSKLSFWKGMIEKYCEFKRSCDFSKSEICKTFVRNNKVPYGLQTVIDEMINSKEIRLKSDFLNDPLNSWTHWAVNSLVKKPFIWGVHLLSNGTNEPSDVIYVHLAVLEKQSEELFLRLRAYCGKVLSLEKIGFMEENFLNNEGLLICLQYLHSLKKLYIQQNEKNRKKIVVKIPNQNEIASPLTEIDYAIYNLENLQDKILKDMEDIEVELKSNDEKIRQYIREGKRSVAKNYLKKKHLLEARIDKKHKSLDNIHTLLAQVQEALTHEEVLGAYKIGSNTLKNLLSKAEMNLDSIDEIVTNVREAVDMHDEIQQAMNSSITDSIEDSSLEDELNALLTHDKQQVIRQAASTEVDFTTKIKYGNKEGENETEKELLAQLEKLELETASPTKSSKSHVPDKHFQTS